MLCHVYMVRFGSVGADIPKLSDPQILLWCPSTSTFRLYLFWLNPFVHFRKVPLTSRYLTSLHHVRGPSRPAALAARVWFWPPQWGRSANSSSRPLTKGQESIKLPLALDCSFNKKRKTKRETSDIHVDRAGTESLKLISNQIDGIDFIICRHVIAHLRCLWQPIRIIQRDVTYAAYACLRMCLLFMFCYCGYTSSHVLTLGLLEFYGIVELRRIRHQFQAAYRRKLAIRGFQMSRFQMLQYEDYQGLQRQNRRNHSNKEPSLRHCM
jgi:hypothetical protein